jgi:signal transduction histidine kinase/CheY-like chemotaxis protein
MRGDEVEPDTRRLRTLLRAAQARATIAERRLQSVLDALPEGVVLLDAEGRYITWNQRYAEIYHQSADLFARGAHLMDTLRLGVERGDYPDAAGREEAWLADREKTLFAADSRVEQRISDGSYLLVEDRRTAEGDIVGLRIDVTEMKARATAAEAANAAKSAFLATISHEIRTPLNGVLGMAQAMLASELSEGQRERIAIIQRSGEALLAILNDVLDLAKIEAGRMTLESIEIDLAELARGVHATFLPIADEKQLSLRLAVDGAQRRYLGDPLRLRQILSNLISNAIKFTDAGEVSVRIGEEEDRLVVAVSDTGVGIAPADLPRLFQKFDQLDSSVTRRFGGTGLGLAICHELASLMGGDIQVESEFGLGSRFVLRLPLPPAPRSCGASARRDAITLAPRAAMRVLAAEDNPVNQLVLRSLLSPLDVEVTIVADGEAAVEAWAAGDWDVVLMDVQMPILDGLAATRCIRALEAERGCSRTPIIAVTANVMSHQVDGYAAAGFDGVVAKPIAVDELFRVLSQV